MTNRARTAVKTAMFLSVLSVLLFAQTAHALFISGQVRDIQGNPIPGVQLSVSGSLTDLQVSDANGNYTILALPGGANITVTPSKAGLTFTPATRVYTGLVIDLSGENYSDGKEWNGAGANALASNPANWVGGVRPVAGDSILFGTANPAKGCFWDLNVPIANLVLNTGFSSSVVAGLDMTMSSATIRSGEFQMRHYDHAISGDFIHTGGVFTADVNGIARFNGTKNQRVAMTGTSSFFFSFRVNSSSSVTALSNLTIDGSFNISSGEFIAGAFVHSLTGGSKTGAGAGSVLNWDDFFGAFRNGGGEIRLIAQARPYRINQGVANSFHHLTIRGGAGVETISNLKVAGDLTIADTGSSPKLDFKDFMAHTIQGRTFVGPNQNSTLGAFILGQSTVNFMGNVDIQGAVLMVNGGRVVMQGPRLRVLPQGTLQYAGATTGRLIMAHASQVELSEGRFETLGPTLVTSLVPGTARYALTMNGSIKIQAPTTIESPDANGFYMSLGANPINLDNMTFRQLPAGGAAFNFDPVTVTRAVAKFADFDASVNINVKARLDPFFTPTADIDMVLPTGARAGAAFESDPDGIVNWGILGTPSNVRGTALGTSSITWTWNVVNEPLGHVVRDEAGNQVSPALAPNATYWIETGLSTNTLTLRKIEAFVDAGTAASEVVGVYTLAVAPIGAALTDIGITSMTVAWNANTNPAATTFVVERSTNGSQFTTVQTGALAVIHPYPDTGLKPSTPHYYRIKARNGDNIDTAFSNVTMSTTAAVPPPVITSISPATAKNLGTLHFTVNGENFISGATVTIKRDGATALKLSAWSVTSITKITAEVDLTGVAAGLYDITVENPDGQRATRDDILTVQNAPSEGEITTGDFVPTAPLLLKPPLSGIQLSVDKNALPVNGRFYLSLNPVAAPIIADPVMIENAAARLNGPVMVPGLMLEAVAFTNAGPFKGNFIGGIRLRVSFPDADNDGIVDTVPLRAKTLKIMTINEAQGVWEEVPNSTVNIAEKYIEAPLQHFSIYGVFGAPANESLDQVKIYPNPWKPGSATLFDATELTFSETSSAGTIRIYTITGALVREISFSGASTGTVAWDGKNADGGPVASGVYLIQIESASGEKRVLKLGVER